MSQRNCKQIRLPRSSAYIAAGRYIGTILEDSKCWRGNHLGFPEWHCRRMPLGVTGWIRGWRRWKIRFRCGLGSRKGAEERSSEEKRKKSLSDVTAGIDADIPVNCAHRCWCGVFVIREIPATLAVRFTSFVDRVYIVLKKITKRMRNTKLFIL